MRITPHGEIVMSEQDLCNLTMQGRDITKISRAVVDHDLDLERMVHFIENPDQLLTWSFPEESDIAVPEFDTKLQQIWFMPQEYRDIDIAKHVLSLCSTSEQLQRSGQELLLFQERNMFDLLRYLRYLVTVMREHNVIWGVGRGSSTASYVLYLLGVHRIDSMFYDLDIREFLR